MKPITVLSLFDGMSCGLVALKRAGIPVAKYYASEIDKYATKISKKNHPEIIELGDINGWKEWDIDIPDLILAGSPCQGFSVAGRGLNFDDPRSKLFFVFVDILNHWRKINPDIKFLLENVKMKGEWRDIITSYMGVEPILINSALVSAQNRQRYYWTNIEGVEQPEDRGIVLADILEDYVPAGLSEKELAYMNRETSDGRSHWDFSHHSDTAEEKSSAVVANFYKGVPYNVLVERGSKYEPSDLGGKAKTLSTHSRVIGANGTTVVPAGLKFVAGLEKGRRLNDGKDNSRNFREGSRIYSPAGEAASLTANPKGGEGGYTGLYQVGEASDIKGHGYNRRVYSAEGKAPTVNSHQGGNLEPKVAIVDIRDYSPVSQKQIRKNAKRTDQKSIALTQNSNITGEGTTPIDMLNGIHYRKLTVVECERLQTLEDGYTEGVSNTQRYKMIGNGWTVDVIAHILKNFTLV